MATQKNNKSSRPVPAKAKTVKGAAPKKVAPKAPVKAKAKPAQKPASPAKPKVKAKPVSTAKAKKPVPVAKKAAPAKPKSASKPIAPVKAAPSKSAPKTIAKASPVSTKPKVTAKPVAKAQPKAAVKKPVVKQVSKPVPKTLAKKPVVSPVVNAKNISTPPAGKAPKSVVVSKAGSASKKPSAPKPMVQAKAKPPVAVHAPIAKVAAKVPAKPAQKPVAVVPKKTETVVSPTKPIPAAPVTQSGSKATDISKKPSVSTHVPAEKASKDEHTETKITKPIAAPAVKQIHKMSEKKEIKPVGVTTSVEEPQKSRYTDKELEEFDQLIDQKLIVAREQLEFYLKQLEDMAENPDNKIKSLDDGLSSLESERISSMASRQQKLIQHLENAKIRIKNKVYGICRETGKLISKERLRAVPHATLSIEAKQAQN